MSRFPTTRPSLFLLMALSACEPEYEWCVPGFESGDTLRIRVLDVYDEASDYRYDPSLRAVYDVDAGAQRLLPSCGLPDSLREGDVVEITLPDETVTWFHSCNFARCPAGFIRDARQSEGLSRWGTSLPGYRVCTNGGGEVARIGPECEAVQSIDLVRLDPLTPEDPPFVLEVAYVLDSRLALVCEGVPALETAVTCIDHWVVDVERVRD